MNVRFIINCNFIFQSFFQLLVLHGIVPGGMEFLYNRVNPLIWFHYVLDHL